MRSPFGRLRPRSPFARSTAHEYATSGARATTALAETLERSARPVADVVADLRGVIDRARAIREADEAQRERLAEAEHFGRLAGLLPAAHLSTDEPTPAQRKREEHARTCPLVDCPADLVLGEAGAPRYARHRAPGFPAVDVDAMTDAQRVEWTRAGAL